MVIGAAAKDVAALGGPDHACSNHPGPEPSAEDGTARHPPVQKTGSVVGRWWCGIDWSETLNDYAVVDEAGAVVARGRIPATPEGVAELLSELSGLNRSRRFHRRQVPIAIETDQGLLVGALRQQGQEIIAITPSVVARYRGRMGPGKKKSDPGDAVMLANAVRVDGHLHRAMHHSSEQATALRILSHAQVQATAKRQQYLLRIRSILRDYFPAALEAWADRPGGILRPEARAVLAVGPTPARAANLDIPTLASLLESAGRTRLINDHAVHLRRHYRDPEQRLRQLPAVEDAHGERMLATLGQLNEACRTVDALTAKLTEAFSAHPHAPIYRSFPGCGALIGARLLGEIGDDPHRFDTARGLRAYAGANPLTWASGNTRAVTHRKTANRILKFSGHQWAFATLTCSPGCRRHYDRRKEAGDRNAAALRNLYGRLLSALHHCLTTGQPYREDIAFPPDPPASTP
ncbi:transposase [Streptomyces xiamenensis]|uniref:IS110 family transposase n=1 Tax=Streptomyces xiamenensis TaxID=408015 RepID=UPI0036EB4738